MTPNESTAILQFDDDESKLVVMNKTDNLSLFEIRSQNVNKISGKDIYLT